MFAIKTVQQASKYFVLNRMCIFIFKQYLVGLAVAYCDLMKCFDYLVSASDGLSTDFEHNA